jgi:hypothetical protein
MWHCSEDWALHVPATEVDEKDQGTGDAWCVDAQAIGTIVSIGRWPPEMRTAVPS